MVFGGETAPPDPARATPTPAPWALGPGDPGNVGKENGTRRTEARGRRGLTLDVPVDPSPVNGIGPHYPAGASCRGGIAAPRKDRASIIRRGPDRNRAERRPGGPPFEGPSRPQRRPAPITDPTATTEGGSERGEADSYAGSAPKDLIWGRHSVQACLESGRPIHRVWCTSEMRFTPRFLGLLRDAKASGVLVEEVTWARLGQITGGAVHQGIVLQPAAAQTLNLPSLIEGCRSIGESPLLIAVDGLTDPQNLGAIVRSAEALGAHGMVLPQRRNAGLTGSVAKVAAGALETPARGAGGQSEPFPGSPQAGGLPRGGTGGGGQRQPRTGRPAGATGASSPARRAMDSPC